MSGRLFGAGVGRVHPARAKLIDTIARKNDAEFHWNKDGSQYWFSTDIVEPAAVKRTRDDIVAELDAAGLWPIVPESGR